jgi:hypothetical protein
MVPRYCTTVHRAERYQRAQHRYSSVQTPLYCTAPYFANTVNEQSLCGILYFVGNKQGPEDDVEAFMNYDRMTRLERPFENEKIT